MIRLVLPLAFLIGVLTGYGCSRVVVGPDCTVAPQVTARSYHGIAIACPTPGILWY